MTRHVSSDVPTVLLVDSDHDDRAISADYLRACGMNAIEIDNTADALREASKADVVITSIQVEGAFDGIELVRRLRERRKTSDKLIIVLAASALNANQRRALAAGCDRFLGSPVSRDRLVREIRTLFTQQGTRSHPSVSSACQRRDLFSISK